MQTLGWIPRFAEILNRSWRRSASVRAFSSSSSDFSNQSRGGLPRFYSEVLPPSKGDLLRVVGDEFWHMTKVLRLKMNDSYQGITWETTCRPSAGQVARRGHALVTDNSTHEKCPKTAPNKVNNTHEIHKWIDPRNPSAVEEVQ